MMPQRKQHMQKWNKLEDANANKNNKKMQRLTNNCLLKTMELDIATKKTTTNAKIK